MSKKQKNDMEMPIFSLVGKEITNLSIDIKIFDRDSSTKIFEIKNQPPKKGMRKAAQILEFKG